jgi:hypothetical protein
MCDGVTSASGRGDATPRADRLDRIAFMRTEPTPTLEHEAVAKALR